MKIKILFTIPNFETAGSGEVVYDLINGLDKNRFLVSLACNHDRGMYFKKIQDLGVQIFIMPTTVPYKPVSTLLKRTKPITEFIKSNNFDIIHSWQWSSDWTEIIASKNAGSKFIFTKKAMGFKSKHWKIKSFLADYIICINDEMLKYFFFKQSKSLIPLGLNHSYYNPENFFKNNSSFFKIVTIANLVPVKGIEILIEAIGKLEKGNIKLSIVGNNHNDYGKFLQQKIRDLKLDEKINFIGKVDDVRPFLAESDLYVIPTLDQGRKEGMPMALVEAMGMGVPVLGSNIEGINYVLKDFKQLLFEPGNIQNLKEKIIMIQNLSQNDRTKLGSTLRDYTKEKFAMAKFIDAHENLYETMAI